MGNLQTKNRRKTTVMTRILNEEQSDEPPDSTGRKSLKQKISRISAHKLNLIRSGFHPVSYMVH